MVRYGHEKWWYMEIMAMFILMGTQLLRIFPPNSVRPTSWMPLSTRNHVRLVLITPAPIVLMVNHQLLSSVWTNGSLPKMTGFTNLKIVTIWGCVSACLELPWGTCHDHHMVLFITTIGQSKTLGQRPTLRLRVSRFARREEWTKTASERLVATSWCVRVSYHGDQPPRAHNNHQQYTNDIGMHGAMMVDFS